MKKKFTILRLLISLSIIGFLVYKLDFYKLYSAVIDNNPLLLVVLISIHYVLVVSINSFNIKIILHAMGYKINYVGVLKSHLIAYSIGQFSPGKIGEFSLTYFLRKKGIGYGEGSSLIVVDKLITLISLVLVAGLGLFIFFPAEYAMRMLAIMALVITLVIFALFSSKIRWIIKRFILRKYSKIFSGFSKNLIYLLKKKKRYIALNFLFTFIRLLSCAFVIWIMLEVIYKININYLFIPTINATGLLMMIIPISISGLGFTEGVVIYLYSKMGVSVVIAGAIMLTLRFLYYLYSSLIILIYLNFSKNRRHKKRLISEKSRINLDKGLLNQKNSKPPSAIHIL